MGKKNPRPGGTGTGAEFRALENLYSAPESSTPAADPHRLHFPRIGEIVEVIHLPGVRLEVVALDDPALVTLRTPNGATLRCGWRTVRRVQS